MTGQIEISGGFRDVEAEYQHRVVDLKKVKEKAKRIKMKDSLVNAICIRIQQAYKKTPEVARCFAIIIAKRVVAEQLDGNPPEHEFRQLMKDAAPLVKSQMLSKNNNSQKQPGSAKFSSKKSVSSRRSSNTSRERRLKK